MLATKTDVARLERRLTTKLYLAGAAVAVLLALLAGACSSEGGLTIPTSPSGPSLTGTWHGWFTSVSTGHRTATMTLFQAGPVLNGFWTIFDPDGQLSGALTGTVVGSTAFLTLRPLHDDTACSLSLVAYVASTWLEGTWSVVDCETENVGTFRLT